MRKFIITSIIGTNVVSDYVILTQAPLTLAHCFFAIAILILLSTALIEGFIYCLPDPKSL